MPKTVKKGPAKKEAKTGRCKHCGAPMKKMAGGGMKCTKCGKMEKGGMSTPRGVGMTEKY